MVEHVLAKKIASDQGGGVDKPKKFTCNALKNGHLKGFHLSQFRQAVSNWQILDGPPKIFWSALVGSGRPWSAQVLGDKPAVQ